MAFEKYTAKYKNGVARFIKRPILTSCIIVIGIAVLVVTMLTTRTGLVPNEDTGVAFCTISMPPATSKVRTKQVIAYVDSMLASNPAVRSREQIVGYNFLAGAGSDQATFVVKLKPFEERNMGQSVNAVLGMIYLQTATIKDAQILAFAPPMISGFSATNAITMTLQDYH